MLREELPLPQPDIYCNHNKTKLVQNNIGNPITRLRGALQTRRVMEALPKILYKFDQLEFYG